MVGQCPPCGVLWGRGERGVHGGPGPTLSGFPLSASRFRSCSGFCGQEPALFYGAPGERREAVESPAGLAAGMRPRFSTGQGGPVRKPRPTHANPERKDARWARTRGGLSLAYFSLATQREVGRAGRRTDRKLLLFVSSNAANKRTRGEGGAHGGPGPTLCRTLFRIPNPESRLFRYSPPARHPLAALARWCTARARGRRRLRRHPRGCRGA